MAKQKKVKYKEGQFVYSYQNPTEKRPINRIRVSEDGDYAHVDSNGNISENIGIGKVINQLSNAGFKDKSWCEKIASQGDSRWLNLFEKGV